MKVGLFIPCTMDMLFPDAGMATLELLEKHGVDVEYPSEQTCCGQPMANSGCNVDAKNLRHILLKRLNNMIISSPHREAVQQWFVYIIKGWLPMMPHMNTLLPILMNCASF